MQKLCIVIPAYNEERRIGETLKVYSDYFENIAKFGDIDYEILVIINNTSDRTEDIVKLSQKRSANVKYLDFRRGGKGFAVREGFKDALKRKNDLIGFVDADLATPPEAFHDLIKNIRNHDGVIASRWHAGSIIKTRQTLLRKIISKGFNFLVKSILFLNFSDTQCGAKLFTRKAVENIVEDINLTEWAFDVDFLYILKSRGFKVIEIPTIWEDKKGSKIDLFFTPMQMFLSILRIRLLSSPFDFVIRAYDKIPSAIKLHKMLK